MYCGNCMHDRNCAAVLFDNRDCNCGVEHPEIKLTCTYDRQIEVSCDICISSIIGLKKLTEIEDWIDQHHCEPAFDL